MPPQQATSTRSVSTVCSHSLSANLPRRTETEYLTSRRGSSSCALTRSSPTSRAGFDDAGEGELRERGTVSFRNCCSRFAGGSDGIKQRIALQAGSVVVSSPGSVLSLRYAAGAVDLAQLARVNSTPQWTCSPRRKSPTPTGRGSGSPGSTDSRPPPIVEPGFRGGGERHPVRE